MSYLATWARRLHPSVTVVHYEDVLNGAVIPGASTYVFTDLERLRPRGLERATSLADALAGRAVVLNHPRDALRRFELLDLLYELGVNRFRAYRIGAVTTPERFPVFLRREDAHNGPASALLYTQEELDAAIADRARSGRNVSKLLIVEFEDVSDEAGVYHRQVTYVIGEELVHGNLAFDTHWVVKYAGPVFGEQLARQRLAWDSKEHVPLLRELAERASVQYGRFDYAIVGDGIQIWELNTNPTLLFTPDRYPPDVRPDRRVVADRITNALARLAEGAQAEPFAWRASTSSRLRSRR